MATFGVVLSPTWTRGRPSMNALASSANAMTTTTSNWLRPMPPGPVVAAPGWALLSEGVRRLAADDNCSRRAGTWLALVRYGTLGGSALGCMPARLVGSSWTLSLPALCWRGVDTRAGGGSVVDFRRIGRGEGVATVEPPAPAPAPAPARAPCAPDGGLLGSIRTRRGQMRVKSGSGDNGAVCVCERSE